MGFIDGLLAATFVGVQTMAKRSLDWNNLTKECLRQSHVETPNNELLTFTYHGELYDKVQCLYLFYEGMADKDTASLMNREKRCREKAEKALPADMALYVIQADAASLRLRTSCFITIIDYCGLVQAAQMLSEGISEDLAGRKLHDALAMQKQISFSNASKQEKKQKLLAEKEKYNHLALFKNKSVMFDAKEHLNQIETELLILEKSDNSLREDEKRKVEELEILITACKFCMLFMDKKKFKEQLCKEFVEEKSKLRIEKLETDLAVLQNRYEEENWALNQISSFRRAEKNAQAMRAEQAEADLYKAECDLDFANNQLWPYQEAIDGADNALQALCVIQNIFKIYPCHNSHNKPKATHGNADWMGKGMEVTHTASGEYRSVLKKCSSCGKPLGKEAAFCSNCGAQVIKTERTNLFCHKCGNGLLEGSMYCNRCGTRVVFP